MDFVSRFLWRLKWFLVLAIVAGPLIAYGGYTDAQRLQRVMNNGVVIEARLNGGRVDEGRYSSLYFLNLAWEDENGPHRSEAPISDALARQIIAGDVVTIDHLTIRYLASDPDRQVAIVRNAPFELANYNEDIWIGFIVGLTGLIFAPLWFWMDYRRQRQEKARSEDIDATLARMRAGGGAQT